jgi:hypothetical protein
MAHDEEHIETPGSSRVRVRFTQNQQPPGSEPGPHGHDHQVQQQRFRLGAAWWDPDGTFPPDGELIPCQGRWARYIMVRWGGINAPIMAWRAPAPAGRRSGHVPPEGRLPREPLAAWRLVHWQQGRRPSVRSHHVGRAGWNENRFLHSSEDQPQSSTRHGVCDQQPNRKGKIVILSKADCKRVHGCHGEAEVRLR